MDSYFLKTLILSAVLGFLIGLERNISFKNSKSFAGSRTFALISMLGFLSAYISKTFPFFIYLAFFGVIFLTIIAYFFKVYFHKKEGSTTHFSAFVAFSVGVLCMYKEIEAIGITIFVVFLLNLKTTLKNIEQKLSQEDINTAILLIAMSILVLPHLPDKMIYFINPYKTWLMAVIISSLSFLGYLGIKLFGEKYGIMLLGAAGGFVSSTAVTYSLSKLYAKIKNINTLYTYAAAIALANTIMFARVYVETSLINKQLATYLALPFLITSILGIIISFKMYKKSSSDIKTPQIINKNPLELDEAIKFALIFAVIYAATYYIGNKYGNVGVYLVSFISGLTDVDAITLSLSSLAKQKLSLTTAAIGISIASVSNTLFKLGIIYFVAPRELFNVLFKFFAFLLGIFIILNIAIYFISS